MLDSSKLKNGDCDEGEQPKPDDFALMGRLENSFDKRVQAPLLYEVARAGYPELFPPEHNESAGDQDVRNMFEPSVIHR